jgi:hypothetical protein
MKRVFAFVAALAVLCGCAGTGKPGGSAEQVTDVRATVTAVDKAQRQFSLRVEGGEEVTLAAPAEMKNFDQLAVGDVVTATYTEAVAWQVRAAGQDGPGASDAASVTAAKPGEKPSVEGRAVTTITATITGIDTAAGTVTLTGPLGNSRTLKARDPSNLKKVKVGDLVDITYSEALAVKVQGAAPR